MNSDWKAIGQKLLEAKRESRAAVGLSNETDLTTLQVAALYDPKTAHDMLAAGIECDLHSACALGLSDQIVRLATTNEFSREVDGLPPLGWALLCAQVGATKTLLECGDDSNRLLARIGFFVWEIEAKGEGEWRPIHLVVSHGYSVHASQLANLLVTAGAPVDAVCVLGEQPIHLACTYGWIEVINELLELGADIDSRTVPCSDRVRRLSSPEGETADHEITPLMIAAREGKVETAKLLLDRGSNVNAQSAAGRTALHVAANAWWHENVQMVEVLLDAGADSNATDSGDVTPFAYAARRNYNKIATKLRSHMR